ncbi:hypothetical protein COCCADRAFT_85618 [Bipolaris zeicola 26-R-13]|uniref:CorA-like transporter domain-containing protein n=1 Tax=Cochliobolus carbonum (strain 26-R-13) TaxID=930089 RepID=W6YIG7_COCC2|nr:uncharacterized protein COCCADRAFT_85618 [Bipolaris zeicola 26-R-13]EUC37473.1 hypothetical protein COCCADRAFT_85618 [Bipolaris zeicola 26-R-13]
MGCDVDYQICSRDIQRHLSSLFVDKEADCTAEVWNLGFSSLESRRNSQGTTKPIISLVRNLQDLENQWKCLDDSSTITMIVIRRKNSWSRMKILPEMFNYIIASVGTPPQFLKIVLGLGQRTSSGYESFTTFYRSFMTPAGPEPNVVANEGFDISYNIRYFEPHGRQLKDPYSCRQSGIHHKFYFQGGRSTWIIIQPPQLFNEDLQQTDSQDKSHPLALHVRLIKSATYYFKEYLSFKASQLGSMASLKTFDAKLSISKPYAEFDTDFSTSQALHQLKKQLLLALEVVDGVSRITQKLLIHLSDPRTFSNVLSQINMKHDLGQISSDMEGHKATIRHLLQVVESIGALNRDILALRNQELLVKNSHVLSQLAQTSASESKTITDMTNRTQQDSRVMRIATVIAMVYLPANLVLSFFSTSLVELRTTTQAESTSARIMVFDQVWVAVVSSFLLVIFNIAALVVWNRLGPR